MELPKRFEQKIKMVESGCWQWQGSLVAQGYGRFAKEYAHRYAYKALVGPIPEGLTIDHLCRSRGCVNPAHLEVVTRGENVLRGEGPAAKAARKTHCPKGHEYAGENLYVNPRTGYRLCQSCQRNAENREARNARVKSWRERNPEKFKAQGERAYAKRKAVA